MPWADAVCIKAVESVFWFGFGDDDDDDDYGMDGYGQVRYIISKRRPRRMALQVKKKIGFASVQ